MMSWNYATSIKASIMSYTRKLPERQSTGIDLAKTTL